MEIAACGSPWRLLLLLVLATTAISADDPDLSCTATNLDFRWCVRRVNETTPGFGEVLWSPEVPDATNVTRYASFGTSLASFSDRLVVGAAFYGTDLDGAAYVYQLHTAANAVAPQLLAKITPDDATGDDHYGRSVALSANALLVGAPYHRNTSTMTSSGAVYLYQFGPSDSVPTFVTKLFATDDSGDLLFGTSVAVYGRTAVVGAPGALNNTGAVYVFYLGADGGSAVQTARLTPSNPQENSFYGLSVAIYEQHVVVGSPDAYDLVGAAYVYTVNGSSGMTSELAELASDTFVDGFGISVAIYGCLIVIGAVQLALGNCADGAYVFLIDDVVDSVTQIAQLQPDRFRLDSYWGEWPQSGYSVAIHGDTIVLGSPSAYDSPSAPPLGAIQIFDAQSLLDANGTVPQAFTFIELEALSMGTAVLVTDKLILAASANVDYSQNYRVGTRSEPFAVRPSSIRFYEFCDVPGYGEEFRLPHPSLNELRWSQKLAASGDYAVVLNQADVEIDLYLYKILNASPSLAVHQQLTLASYTGTQVDMSWPYVLVRVYEKVLVYRVEESLDGSTTMALHANLTGDETQPTFFGGDIALAGNTAIASALHENSSAGAAYVFKIREDGQVHRTRIASPVNSSFFYFATNVAISPSEEWVAFTAGLSVVVPVFIYRLDASGTNLTLAGAFSKTVGSFFGTPNAGSIRIALSDNFLVSRV